MCRILIILFILISTSTCKDRYSALASEGTDVISRTVAKLKIDGFNGAVRVWFSGDQTAYVVQDQDGKAAVTQFMAIAFANKFKIKVDLEGGHFIRSVETYP